MLRLLHHCLIAICLAGSLMLLPLCCAEDAIIFDHGYNSTALPDYEYDYDSTINYTLFNVSLDYLERFLGEKDYEDEKRGLDTSHTDPQSTMSTSTNKAFRTVYPSSLLMLILAAHQLLRLL